MKNGQAWRRVLLVDKLTRYESCVKGFSSAKEKSARQRFPSMYSNFVTHRNACEGIKCFLKERGVDFASHANVATGENVISARDFNGVDAVISAGGDGTYLDAAALISPTLGTGHLPLFGINTDNFRSEGRLCMNRQGESIDQTLMRAWNGEFEALRRQRMRVRVHTAVDSSDVSVASSDASTASEMPYSNSAALSLLLLSHRPLNDAMVAALHSMTTVYCEVQIDDYRPEKQKHSGLIVSTGTGSSAWTLNARKTGSELVEAVLRNLQTRNVLRLTTPPKQTVTTSELAKAVADEVNDSIVFPPESPLLAWTIREPIENRIFKVAERQGFARRVRVAPLSTTLYLFLDGLTAIPLRHNQTAEFTMDPSDSLLTAV